MLGPRALSADRSSRDTSPGSAHMGGPVSSVNSLTVDDLGSAAQRDRRKRILDATIALASKGGFDAVQMRAVAESADVALGTLYRYFPSKIHLLVSALGREFERRRGDQPGEADPGRHRRRPRHVRAEPDDARPAGRPAPHRGADPGVHVRRRLGRQRDPRRRHAADLDAHPRHARARRTRAHRGRHGDRARHQRRLARRAGRLGHRPHHRGATSSSGWTSPSACCCAEPNCDRSPRDRAAPRISRRTRGSR